MKKVELYWEGPFSEDDLFEGKSEFEEKGIYQIYGTHPCSGDNSLLYVGQTKDSFKKRLNSEINSNNNWYTKTSGAFSFYLAKVDEEFSIEDIDIVEKLLITAHMPPCNSQNLTIYEGAKLIPENILVWNTGYYYKLLRELSTAYYGMSE